VSSHFATGNVWGGNLDSEDGADPVAQPNGATVTDRRVSAKHWPTFAESASPEAITVYLALTAAERDSLDRYIAKLETLLERRTAEKTAGTWPTDGNKEQQ
jgi:hypothetical protein